MKSTDLAPVSDCVQTSLVALDDATYDEYLLSVVLTPFLPRERCKEAVQDFTRQAVHFSFTDSAVILRFPFTPQSLSPLLSW